MSKISRFLKKYPKLAAAFNGAAKNPLHPRNLMVNGIGTAMSTGLCTAFLVASGAGLPAALSTMYSSAASSFTAWFAMDSATGAYKGVKAYNKKTKPPRRDI